jgi:hypothetical protein
VRLVSPIDGATGGSGNLSTSLSNVAMVASHPKFVWVFNANYDWTIIYNDPVRTLYYIFTNHVSIVFLFSCPSPWKLFIFCENTKYLIFERIYRLSCLLVRPKLIKRPKLKKNRWKWNPHHQKEQLTRKHPRK